MNFIYSFMAIPINGALILQILSCGPYISTFTMCSEWTGLRVSNDNATALVVPMLLSIPNIL